MRSLHFFCNQLIPGMFNSLSTNVPLIDKPDSWFLLGKCLKNTCGRVSSTCIFTKNVTLPQVFLKHFASKNQLPGFYISRTFVKIITVSNLKLRYLRFKMTILTRTILKTFESNTFRYYYDHA